jgi:uncharacterized RDD family membrane protein YckC
MKEVTKMAEESRKGETQPTGGSLTESPKVEEPQPSAPLKLSKADIGKRAVAAIIDVVISYIIGFVPIIGWLIGAAYMALRDGFTFEPVVGQSLGKKLLNLKAVVIDSGQKCDYMTSIRRNLPFIIPMVFMAVPVIGWIIGAVVWALALVVEVILVVTDENGDRLGDRIAGTRVIEINA